MSYARDLVYSFVDRVAHGAVKYGLDAYDRAVEPGSSGDDYLHGLLNQVEDDCLHKQAEKIRAAVKADPAYRPKGHQAMLEVAEDMDPYKRVDGQLVRKSDGHPVIP